MKITAVMFTVLFGIATGLFGGMALITETGAAPISYQEEHIMPEGYPRVVSTYPNSNKKHVVEVRPGQYKYYAEDGSETNSEGKTRQNLGWEALGVSGTGNDRSALSRDEAETAREINADIAAAKANDPWGGQSRNTYGQATETAEPSAEERRRMERIETGAAERQTERDRQAAAQRESYGEYQRSREAETQSARDRGLMAIRQAEQQSASPQADSPAPARDRFGNPVTQEPVDNDPVSQLSARVYSEDPMTKEEIARFESMAEKVPATERSSFRLLLDKAKSRVNSGGSMLE